jgi:hypothetical protein
LQLLGEIKGWFEGQSLNFFRHLMWWQLLFCPEAIRITQVWLQHLREVFGVMELRLCFHIQVAILDPTDFKYTFIENDFDISADLSWTLWKCTKDQN